MKRAMLWLSALLALCLMMGAAALAEEDAVVSAPVDVPAEEIEAEIWTEEIANDVDAYEGEQASTEASKDGDFEIVDGVLVAYHGEGGDVAVPAGVETIGSCAFGVCQSLTGIRLPTGVTCIEDYAFRDCRNLKSVRLPDGLAIIMESAFSGCKSLEGIVLPNGLEYIDYRAFCGCESLASVEFPSTLTTIMPEAFESCTSLTCIDLPDSLNEIGEFAFSSCSGLTDIRWPEGPIHLGDSVFGWCNGLTDLELPGSLSNEGSMFFECTGLTHVTVREGMTKLPDNMFQGCTSLEQVSLPAGLVEIGQFAFYNCDMTNIRLPESLETIGAHAFQGCGSLKSITIPKNVKRMGDSSSALGWVFYGCPELRSVTVEVAGDVPWTDVEFGKCEALTTFYTRCETPATQWARERGYNVVTTPHELIVDAAVMPTCTQDGLSEATYCVVCGQYTVAPEVIPALGHDKVTDPAVKPTLTRTGLTEGSHCARCGEVLVAQQVVPKLVALSKCTVAAIDDKAYTGKAIKPAPVVKRGTKTLKKGTDYTVAYANNTAVGKATVTIKGKGAYTGTVKKTFRILPKKVALSSLTAGKGKLTVKWTKSAGAGYQIQYSLKSDFSTKKTVTIAKAGTIRTTLKNLKSGKNYYVRIRGYRLVGGKAYASAWSKAKKIKVK